MTKTPKPSPISQSCSQHSDTNIVKLSSTHFVYDIRHQHRCSHVRLMNPNLFPNGYSEPWLVLYESYTQSAQERHLVCNFRPIIVNIIKSNNLLFENIQVPTKMLELPKKKLIGVKPRGFKNYFKLSDFYRLYRFLTGFMVIFISNCLVKFAERYEKRVAIGRR